MEKWWGPFDWSKRSGCLTGILRTERRREQIWDGTSGNQRGLAGNLNLWGWSLGKSSLAVQSWFPQGWPWANLGFSPTKMWKRNQIELQQDVECYNLLDIDHITISNIFAHVGTYHVEYWGSFWDWHLNRHGARVSWRRGVGIPIQFKVNGLRCCDPKCQRIPVHLHQHVGFSCWFISLVV